MGAKTPTELAQEFAQAVLSVAPVIILGSGASAAHQVPGMGALAAHLTALALPAGWDAAERAEWASLIAKLHGGQDLESALQAIRPSPRQTLFVAAETRRFLLPYDEAVLRAVFSDRRALPLSRLYNYLFDSTHKNIFVVTPNYDRIAEYAADAADVSTFTGFSHGYLQHRARSPRTRVHVAGQPARTVCVWKVHGSLDWFQTPNYQAIGLRSGVEPLADFEPLMVTPGLDKYRLTHVEPFRTIFSCADAALEEARAFFCVGYGFNDQHVQEKLIERCDRESVPMVLITKQLTQTAREFLASGRCRRFLAIEEGLAGAKAYTPADPAGFDIDQPIWAFGSFLDFTLGVAP